MSVEVKPDNRRGNKPSIVTPKAVQLLDVVKSGQTVPKCLLLDRVFVESRPDHLNTNHIKRLHQQHSQ